jgi:hypothetical protein
MNTAVAQATFTTSTSVSGDAAAMSPIWIVVWLVLTVALVVAVWKIFVKAGQPGWASLIPLYNTIVLLRITGKSGWWVLGLMVPFLNFFVLVRLVFNLATVFGRGMGFGFGLLFLSPIFILILAFGDAQYVGLKGSHTPPVAPGGFAPAPVAP